MDTIFYYIYLYETTHLVSPRIRTLSNIGALCDSNAIGSFMSNTFYVQPGSFELFVLFLKRVEYQNKIKIVTISQECALCPAL